MGKLIFVLGLLFLFLAQPPVSYGSATDVWVTQSGAGGKDGTSLQNAASISFIQSSSNCGNGPTQIGPGTTIHLSGNFAYPTGTNGAIALACSGASGNPVILTTDPNTRPVTISSPQFGNGAGSGGGGALSLSGLSYVKVDGGVPCGTTAGGVDSASACGLVMENTGSGTAFDVGPYNEGQSGILDAGGVTGIEVTGVALLNSYVRLPNWAISSVSFSGSVGTVNCAASCPVGKNVVINIVGNSAVGANTNLTVTGNNEGGSSFTVSGGPGSGSGSGGTALDETMNTSGRDLSHYYSIIGFSPGIKFHDSIAAHGGWLVDLQGAAVQIYNNQIYDFDHGIAMTPVDANDGQTPGVGTPGPFIHDNHIHDMVNWDDSIGRNNNHHDGIHLLLDTTNPSNQDYYTSAYIYNNVFDGDPGVPNAWIFARASTENEAVFNNVFGCTPARHLNITELGDSTEPGSFTRDALVLNNTVTCTGNYTGGGAATGWTAAGNVVTSGVQDINNILQGQQFDWAVVILGVTWAPGGIDYNVYENNAQDSGNSGAHPFGTVGIGGTTYDTLAAWQGYLAKCGCAPVLNNVGQDRHSYLATNSAINLASNGQLHPGSPAIGNGLNLSSMCTGNLAALCQDKAGNARSATGPWDIGAYTSGSSANQPAAPTGLAAVVQ
jgi:hypothetical protein